MISANENFGKMLKLFMSLIGDFFNLIEYITF